MAKEKMSELKLGDCYKANGKKIIEMINIPNCFLCHGTVVGQKGTPVEGQCYDHCWIEIQDVVMDFSNGQEIIIKKEVYYDIGVIKNVIRYKPKEAIKLSFKHRTWGPWR